MVLTKTAVLTNYRVGLILEKWVIERNTHTHIPHAYTHSHDTQARGCPTHHVDFLAREVNNYGSPIMNPGCPTTWIIKARMK